MAYTPGGRTTLLDVARASDPNGKLAMVAEVLDQSNPILQDAPSVPSNAPMGNRVTLRSSLPTPAWGKLNQGYNLGKGGTRQATDGIGMINGRSEVDIRLAAYVGAANYANERRLQDRAWLEAINQTVAGTVFYGVEAGAANVAAVAANEASFTGLAPRMAASATAITGSQIKLHHGSPSGSDYTSMYIADWHPDYVSLIHPEGSVAGLSARDLGERDVFDAEGLPFTADVMAYDWNIGLTVRDPRHIARLANIDVSQALTDTSTLLKNSLLAIINRMPSPNGANRVIYCSRNLMTAFQLQIEVKGNVFFTWQDYLGQKTMHFQGYPIRVCDQVSELESTIS